jgi:hypothetical protein
MYDTLYIFKHIVHKNKKKEKNHYHCVIHFFFSLQTMGLKMALVTYSRGRRNSVLVITVLTKPINMDKILTLFHMKLPCLDYKAELGCLVELIYIVESPVLDNYVHESFYINRENACVFCSPGFYLRNTTLHRKKEKMAMLFSVLYAVYVLDLHWHQSFVYITNVYFKQWPGEFRVIFGIRKCA